MYVQFPESSVKRPIISLKGFERISLKPGEKQKLELKLEAGDLAYWDVGKDEFNFEEGPLTILVGSASKNLHLDETIQVSK